MNTQLPDSSAKRGPITVTIITGLVLVAVAIYVFFGTAPSRPVNGPKIIAAARAYTHALLQRHSPIPPTVSLQTLIDQGLLQPTDVGSLQGMDANIFLTAAGGGPPALMRVHMTDGMDLVLLADGSTQEIKR